MGIRQRFQVIRGERTANDESFDFETRLAEELDGLYRAACRLVRDPDRAQDLLQETSLAAWRHRRQLRDPEVMRSWLYRILMNTFINQYHKERRRKRKDELSIDEEDSPELPDETYNPLNATLFEHVISEEVQTAFEAIPETFRMAVYLHDIEGWAHKEIAETLQIPMGSVGSKIHRGRRLLAAELETYARERGFTTDG